MTDGASDKAKLGSDYWRLWTSSVVSNLGDGVAAIAYPWLASSVTRSGFLIALIAVAQRLPWLVATLPAGVITDRVDRRKIIVLMDVTRACITFVVALFVLRAQSDLLDPEAIEAGAQIATNASMYTVILLAALAFGFAEVLRDNAAQTIVPAIVSPEALEKANGQMWGSEVVANSLVGPLLGSFLIGVGFVLPFLFDAGSFAVAAGLIFLIAGKFGVDESEGAPAGKTRWRTEIAEGFGWLWRHPLLRPMAVILGLMNGLGMVTAATFVLFAQEVLGANAYEFSLLGTGGALGGILAAVYASKVSSKLGSGVSLYLTLGGSIAVSLVVGVSSSWIVVWAAFGVFTFVGILWNVVTVSLRQTIIPDRLLGRVNSVYRFFAWGMMPIGSLIGGLLVVGAERFGSREFALRMPWFVAAVGFAGLCVYAAPKLTTEGIESARAAGIAMRDVANE